MADVTDKKRLRQVQQQDLTESRLNDDFVFWLKTKGWNYLLVLLVIACGYSFLNLYWQKKEQGRDAAWAELTSAQISGLAESFSLVAEQHKDIDSVALIAWLNAGDTHLRDLQVGMIAPAVATGPDGTPNAPEPLTDETRKVAQDAADGYYQKVLEKLGARTSETALKPIAISALFGRAAVAESRRSFDQAKAFLTEAQTLAGDTFVAFADEATRRLASLDALASAVELPTRASLPARPDAAPLAPNVTDELTRSLTAPVPTPAPAQPTTPPVQPNLGPTPLPGQGTGSGPGPSTGG